VTEIRTDIMRMLFEARTKGERLYVSEAKEELEDKASERTIEKAIKEIHPYEEPEIIAVPIVGGSEGYLKWLEYELKSR